MARVFELTTPLGKDVLLFRALNGREELGRLSEFDVSAVSMRPDISPGDLLGKNVTVKVELRAGSHRYLNGYVTRFGPGAMVGRYYAYRMTVSPWLWFLTRTTDCRIFQEKTVPEIIKEVFADHPMTAFEDGLTGKYARREYCVQYRESDFHFVSRLAEEEGIYYYFEHTDGRHVLKLVDSHSGHTVLPKASIPYYPPGKQVRVDEEFIHAWTFCQNIQPGVVASDAFDFTKPKVDLAVKARLLQAHDHADYEWFDAPGAHQDIDNGEQSVRARIDEFHSEFERARAESNVREIAVGRLFTLINAPRRDQEGEYLIVSASYDLHDNAYESSSEDATSYHCAFTVLKTSQQFRPARITPEPFMRGPQTAVVVGPSTEEIWTDQYGRVKVQFHWDRYGKSDENASCWIRVSHPWAGKGWGAVAIPRIGQEVIVDFLEGDPDQPIITGRVYNADAMPPYALPAGAVVSGIKSNSTTGGGGFNEISMNDTKGRELLNVHAQYDMKTEIQHDDTQIIHNDRKITVDGTHTEDIEKDTTITIKTGKLVHKVAKNTAAYTVQKALTETYNANQDTTVGGNLTIKVTGTGENGGGKILIQAKEEIVLHSGESTLTMRKDGTILIVGKNITIKGTEKVRVDAPDSEVSGSKTAKIGVGHQNTVYDTTKVGVSGAAINSSAVGLHEIVGALVKIN